MQNNFNVNPEEAKGFMKKLLSLDSFVTPKIIHIFYIICLIGIGLLFLAMIASAILFIFSGAIGSGLVYLVVAFFILIIYTIIIRINVELTILAFKNNEYLKKISEK
ncbi:DUF4282 domain-containing protein [Bartonella sp. HY761]|uniref:DUF4282 domain-containing protein n=1 Tax=Bartonella sp. HY761 TaxID=2979330 RepID=UPI0021FF9085|nr:DUF4282 domain-containing protein [Bartonella sp. HY761]UXN07025.1 DUF4282 domain-containing protein [Bartonella sp. HY761]